jgi:hypothetical protein
VKEFKKYLVFIQIQENNEQKIFKNS